jgi:hypothetical protein
MGRGWYITSCLNLNAFLQFNGYILASALDKLVEYKCIPMVK